MTLKVYVLLNDFEVICYMYCFSVTIRLTLEFSEGEPSKLVV